MLSYTLPTKAFSLWQVSVMTQSRISVMAENRDAILVLQLLFASSLVFHSQCSSGLRGLIGKYNFICGSDHYHNLPCRDKPGDTNTISSCPCLTTVTWRLQYGCRVHSEKTTITSFLHSVKKIKFSDILRNQTVDCSHQSKWEVSSTEDATTKLSSIIRKNAIRKALAHLLIRRRKLRSFLPYGS